MIDPLGRWAAHGAKPDYAGLPSFAGQPYTEDPADLVGVDVAIVGAPTDDLVSDRPGARFGPRAIRAAGRPGGPHLEVGVDALSALRVVDFGDAPVVPADVDATHAAIEATVGQVLAAGAIPVILGGDHGIAEPDIRACAAKHGPVGLVHLDAHADTAESLLGVARSHGTPMRRLVEAGHVDPERYVQIGLRGYSPDAEQLAWQHDRGITSIFMHDVRDRGIAAVVDEALAVVGAGRTVRRGAAPVFLSVDVDVLDPAYAPGTGTPEPGGMTSADLLWACRRIAAGVDLVGMEVVEVLPEAIGARDVTALVAERAIREALTGVAMRRRPPHPPVR
ncbi:MAG: agmatinase family protein [Solirubrobacteraceae bacterium]|nr:agmatinase family protein [Solirubrobacteraceae bacterium]